MRQHRSVTGRLHGRGVERPLILLITGCIVLGVLLGGACATGSTSQPQVNPGEQQGASVPPPDLPQPVTPVTPVEPLHTPPIPETPAPADQGPAQPPVDTNPPPASSLDASTLITGQASQMKLNIDDMGPGWTLGNAIAPAIQQVTSSSHTYFTQGSSYAPGVQNTVAVYRNMASAVSAFDKERQANLAASNPGIGDESLLNATVPINKLLVFRKNNVVVWLWLKQYKEGDIERYARIVEQRVLAAAAAPPVSPQPPPQQVQTPDPLPAPAQPAEATIPTQAYQMVLTMEDMGLGWIKGNVSPPSYRDSTSSSQVSYSQGSNFAPTVQNTAVVYRSAAAAIKAYSSAKPSNASLSSPSIGDECFLNNSVPIDRLLVFRKGNVVEWIWLKQYKTGDIEAYARTVEKKLNP